MGCIPSREEAEVNPRDGVFYRASNDDGSTITFVDYSASGRTGSCPHLLKSTTTLESNSSRVSSDEAEAEAEATKEESNNKKGPSFVSVLFQTILLLALIGAFGYLIVYLFPAGLFQKLYGCLQEIPSAAKDLYEEIKKMLKEFDFGSILSWPLEGSETDDGNWDGKLKVEFYLALCTTVTFVVDLLTSDEASRGNWILLIPSLAYSIVYGKISIHAQATKLLNPEILRTFDTAKISEAIFSQPEMVVMLFTHFFALNLALAFAMMKDFYLGVSSRRIIYRLVMAPVVVATVFQGIITVPVYLILKATLFSGPKIQKRKLMPIGSNSHRREFNYLLDDIPEAEGSALNGWVRNIPAPFDLPFFVGSVALGTIRFVLALVVYFAYVIFLCLPYSAIFMSLPRAWNQAGGKSHKGALYGPFETVNGYIFPPKAAVVVSGHLRLLCLKRHSNWLFNLFIGRWLRPLLANWTLYEFLVFPFSFDVSPYCAFLMEEFGPVYPMGGGLGFGTYKDVKRIIENPDQRKGGKLS
jgi:hypothetical protein